MEQNTKKILSNLFNILLRLKEDAQLWHISMKDFYILVKTQYRKLKVRKLRLNFLYFYLFCIIMMQKSFRKVILLFILIVMSF